VDQADRLGGGRVDAPSGERELVHPWSGGVPHDLEPGGGKRKPDQELGDADRAA
jgi:hypothetical protein